MNGISWPAAATAFAVAALAGWAIRPFARRFDLVDVPGGRKGHARPTPLLGGVALMLGWTAGLAAGGGRFDATFVAAASAWAIGTLDDLRPGGLAPRTKLLGQVAVVVLWLVVGGWGGMAAIAAFAIVLFAMNGFNLLDNSDGLCVTAALGPSAGCVWLAAAIGTGSLPAGAATAGLAGALLGALLWNLPPARLFLGDGGSHLIGFLVGAQLVQLGLAAGAEPLALPGIAAAFLLLPLLDTTTVVVARLRRGIHPWIGDRRHLSHRLHRAGWGEWGALVLLGSISALGAALGVLALS